LFGAHNGENKQECCIKTTHCCSPELKLCEAASNFLFHSSTSVIFFSEWSSSVGRRHNRASFRTTPLRVVRACSPNALALTGLLGLNVVLRRFSKAWAMSKDPMSLSSIDRAIRPIDCSLPSFSVRRAAALSIGYSTAPSVHADSAANQVVILPTS
jgi:hypothetical protein